VFVERNASLANDVDSGDKMPSGLHTDGTAQSVV